MNFNYPVMLIKKDIYDDSKLIKESKGKLDDNRPFLAQAWAESGYTFLTYFFSSEGIEHFESEEILNYLKAMGINLESSMTKPEVALVNDSNGLDCWRITLVIGEMEE